MQGWVNDKFLFLSLIIKGPYTLLFRTILNT